MEIKFFCLCCELGHVDFMTCRMRGDEVGDELLFETVTRIDPFKKSVEFVIELEGGFTHDVEHCLGCMLSLIHI